AVADDGELEVVGLVVEAQVGGGVLLLGGEVELGAAGPGGAGPGGGRPEQGEGGEQRQRAAHAVGPPGGARWRDSISGLSQGVVLLPVSATSLYEAGPCVRSSAA